MADIHPVPDASMVAPEQSFHGEPLEDLSGAHPLQVNIAAGMNDDGDHGAAMNLPAELTDGDGMSLGLNLAPSLSDDGSPG